MLLAHRINFLLYFSLLLSLMSSIDVYAEENQPNEMGLVPVMEYHRIGLGERTFTRSVENFKRDLLWLYNNDYVLITVHDFIGQKINISRGKKPVIFTFDDSSVSQFSYIDENTIDSSSAVGLMDAFFREHLDFGRSAIFYVNSTFFEQPKYKKRKLEYLLATGREIGNHTLNHTNLAKAEPSQIQADIGSLAEYINNLALRSVEMTSLAYPFGGIPKKEEALRALKKGSYNSSSYTITSAFLVGADPSHPPYGAKFDSFLIPRIQADDGEWKRWFGRMPGSTDKEDGSELFTPFTSDGDSDLLTVSEKKLSLLDKSKVRKGVKICILEKEDCKSIAKINSTYVLQEQNIVNLPIVGTGSIVSDIQPSTASGALTEYREGIFNRFHDRIGREFNSFLQSARERIPHITVNVVPAELKFQNGSFKYSVKDGDTLKSIVLKFLPYTEYYLSSQLQLSVETINGLKNGLIRPADVLIIPGIDLFIYDKKPDFANRKGIYWTGYIAGSNTALQQVQQLQKAGGNMVIFDIKETEGMVFFSSTNPLAQELKLVNIRIPDVAKFVRYLHQNGIYAVARIAVFKDSALAKAKPVFVPKDKQTGKPWSNRDGIVWVDPSRTEVQEYNIQLAEEVARLGVDEVQFDYVRFPEKTMNDGDYFYDEEKQSRVDIITDFIAKASDRIRPLGAKLSVDVFGAVVWNNGYDGKIVGQDMKRLAPYVDVIYPMTYPSHFAPGFANHKNPGAEPYFFVQESMKKFQTEVDSKAQLIPWIQGFSWGATGYGTEYIRQQIKAASDIGINSFAIWNAGNRYDLAWGAF